MADNPQVLTKARQILCSSSILSWSSKSRRVSQLLCMEAIHHPPASSQSSLSTRQGAAYRRSVATHAALKLIPGCHLVRLKFSSLGRSSVIYANKPMHSHKICKDGYLSVWHSFQFSEPSDAPDTCKTKHNLP